MTATQEAVSEFGERSRIKLAGAGEPEEALRAPLEVLFEKIGISLGLTVVLEGEVHLKGARPDFAVRVDGAIVGYLEVKKPRLDLDPATFKGDNLRQWEALKDLPNLIYTNGLEWRRYRSGELVSVDTLSGGEMRNAGASLSSGPSFEVLTTGFLRWDPQPITSVLALVKTLAPLTKLLREQVAERLDSERILLAAGTPISALQFLSLSAEWRELLFPSATDKVFADGFAQTVTFGLLLAKTEGLDLATTTLHDLGAALDTSHSLMGRALQLLTDDLVPEIRGTVELMARVTNAVVWNSVRRYRGETLAGLADGETRNDAYLHLYERFLAAYDPALRKKTGTYYTPWQIVDQMVRLTKDALKDHLGKERGFLDQSVVTLDPALGTGTFLNAILQTSAQQAELENGAGDVPLALTDLARRLIGFEMQLGAYAVAELRVTDLLKTYGADGAGARLYVTNTLDDPNLVATDATYRFAAISESRRQADLVKANAKVTVVIGNPPYGDKAGGQGSWVEGGNANSGAAPILDDFKLEGNGVHEHILSNHYVYFWRWATWKVFESIPESDQGIVCYITSAGYLSGPGTKGMRAYLRRQSTRGWIINLTPEGKRPPAGSQVFDIETPVAIALFVRDENNDTTIPARISYTSLSGLTAEKYEGLAALRLDDETQWRDARSGWADAFTPAALGEWDEFPALDDIFPWFSAGVSANRRWPIAPAEGPLKRRWLALKTEPDPTKRAALLKETGDRSWNKKVDYLPGQAPAGAALGDKRSLSDGMNDVPQLKRILFRSLDRQWIIADKRVLDRPRPPLWEADLVGDQIYLLEQHSVAISTGPGVTFTTLLPDLNAFDNRGGRTLPLFHPDGSANVAPGLLAALSERLGRAIGAPDLAAYIAGVTSHPDFVECFADELITPGVRVPLTGDATLFDRAVAVGRESIWLQTYGERFAAEFGGASVRNGIPADDLPLNRSAVQSMPVDIEFDPDANEILLRAADGLVSGRWGPVQKSTWDYRIGGMRVVESWFDYRKLNPVGRVNSPLQALVDDAWTTSLNNELTDLLTVIERLVGIESTQSELLLDVLASDLITLAQLAEAGVQWPVADADRDPRSAHSDALFEL